MTTDASLTIGYLSTHYPHVTHTFIQNEVLALEQRGVEVVPMALNSPSSGDVLTERDERERRRTFYVKAVPKARMVAVFGRTLVRHPAPFVSEALRSLVSGGLDVGAGLKAFVQFLEAVLVWNHLRGLGVTALHAHFGQAPASVAWRAARFGDRVDQGRWTWSVTIHGWHEFATEDTSELRAKFGSADLIVGISDFTRSQLLRLTPPSRWDRITVVRCGIDLDTFRRREPRPPSSPPTVVITARLSPEKGHMVLLDAVAELAASGMEVQVEVIGDGELHDEIVATAKRLDIGHLVDMRGAQPPQAVAEALEGADVFCLPSFAEGLPVSLMEAMARGVPVVTTYISGIPELVVPDETGWVVPAGNPTLLASALREVLASDDLGPVLDSARAAVEARHDQRLSAVELEAALRACHGRGGDR